MSFNPIIIPDRLKRARSLLGKTQKQLASEIGVSVTTISQLENRASDTLMSTVQRLCEALDVSPNYLSGYELLPSPFNGYLPITHDPANCSHCEAPCDRNLICPDCGEHLTAGDPHPTGDCMMAAWGSGKRTIEYLALRHGIPAKVVKTIVRGRGKP